MANKQIYAVWDKIAQDLTGGLMVFTHDAPVIRIFTDGLADASTMLNKHPQDYDLVCLGEVDTQDGECVLFGMNKPRVVLSGATWAEMQRQEVAANA